MENSNAEKPSNAVLEKDGFIGDYMASSICLIVGIILLPFAFGNGYKQSQSTVHFNDPRDVW